MMRMEQSAEERIRELFLQRRPSYRLSEAARLLGMPRGQLEREARADQEEAYRVNGRWCFTWRQVAHLAFRRWSLAEIHEALGTDAVSVLPPLLTLRAMTVRLPEFLVRAIEVSAAADDMTIDDWLQHELVAFAGTVVDRIERAVPGYRRAYFYPGEDRRQHAAAR